MADKFDAYLTGVHAQDTEHKKNQILTELPSDLDETVQTRMLEAADQEAQTRVFEY